MSRQKFEVSRRGLFGSAIAAAAAGGGAVAAVAGAAHGAGVETTGTGSGSDTVYPFEGAHQQGIITPAQAAAAYLAFDVEAANRDELQAMFKTLTTQARWLTAGGVAPDAGMTATTLDNGVLGGPSTPADGLTITVSVGASLFDGRYGLAAKKPHRLTTMPAFADDLLDPALCHGDLLIQVCADHQDTVNRALRILLRETRGALAVRWRQDGFQSPSRPDGAPRNLLGFKDGTANAAITPDTYDQLVWTHAGGSEPGWVEGGSYHVVRKIRMLVEFWDRVSVREQNTLIGRDKTTGAPLTGTQETDEPDFDTQYKSEAIPLGAHIRLAADSGRSATTGQRMLRRGYNYDAGMDVNGNLDMGLLFTTFNQDLERQFATVQRRLEGESLADYILPVGGGYFFALPGVQGSDDWLGREMFA
jgi:deferrochelatase/peroxidase EfeB